MDLGSQFGVTRAQAMMSDNPVMDVNETLWLYRIAGGDFAAEADQRPDWLQKARSLGQWQVPVDGLGTALEAALCDLAGEATPPGLFPWAEWGASQAGHGAGHWAEMHLLHWHVRNGQVWAMAPQWPDSASLDRLWDELAEFIASDGLTLFRVAPDRAWVRGDAVQGLPTASLDKVMGRPVAGFLPASDTLRRLQSELQMWFYHHPSLQQASVPINSVWFSGTGRLTPALSKVLKRLQTMAGAEPPSRAELLWASDERASLWRTDDATVWQRMVRRWRPLRWEAHGHDLD